MALEVHVLTKQVRVIRFFVRRMQQGTREENRVFTTWLLRHHGLQHFAAGIRLAARTAPFERIVQEPSASILFDGESSARGVGALPEESVAGLIGQNFPRVSIRNRAQNGSTVRGLYERLEENPPERSDLFIIFIGTNDIFQMRSLEEIQWYIHLVLEKAREIAPHVILGQGGDVGSAPAFRHYPDIARIMTDRTRVVQDIFRRASQRHGVHFLELFDWSRSDECTDRIHDLFHPEDGVHPSARCYREVYARTLQLIERTGICL